MWKLKIIIYFHSATKSDFFLSLFFRSTHKKWHNMYLLCTRILIGIVSRTNDRCFCVCVRRAFPGWSQTHINNECVHRTHGWVQNAWIATALFYRILLLKIRFNLQPLKSHHISFKYPAIVCPYGRIPATLNLPSDMNGNFFSSYPRIFCRNEVKIRAIFVL